LQDKFIASLELPTYHNFSCYQFLDILEALSFRLMVLDHIKHQSENTKESTEDLKKNVQGPLTPEEVSQELE